MRSRCLRGRLAYGISMGLLASLPLGVHAKGSSRSRSLKCVAAKRLVVGTKIAALLACDAKAASKGKAVAPECEAKAKNAFAVSWSRVETHAGGSCTRTGDVDLIEVVADQHQVDLENSLLVTGNASRCTALELRSAGRAAACRLRCAARAARSNVPLDDPALAGCLSACSDRLEAAFTRARAMPRGSCHANVDAEVIGELDVALLTDLTNMLPLPTTTTTSPVTTTTTLKVCLPSDGACTEDAQCCTGMCNNGRCDCYEQADASGITAYACGGGMSGTCLTDARDGRHVCAADCSPGCSDCPPNRFCGLTHFEGLGMYQDACCAICSGP